MESYYSILGYLLGLYGANGEENADYYISGFRS